MEVIVMDDKRKPAHRIKGFLKKRPEDFNVGEALIMTACTVFVTGVVTVSINTSIDITHNIMNARKR